MSSEKWVIERPKIVDQILEQNLNRWRLTWGVESGAGKQASWHHNISSSPHRQTSTDHHGTELAHYHSRLAQSILPHKVLTYRTVPRPAHPGRSRMPQPRRIRSPRPSTPINQPVIFSACRRTRLSHQSPHDT